MTTSVVQIIDTVLILVGTGLISLMTYRLNRRDARSKEISDKVDSTNMQLTVLTTQVLPVVGLAKEHGELINNHTTQLAVLTERFDRHEEWAGTEIARLDKRTFYNG